MDYETTMKFAAVRNIEFATSVVDQWDRETCCRVLSQFGFGTGNNVQPADWRTYYNTDELRDFALQAVFPAAE